MKMNRFLIALLSVFLWQSQALAQSDEVPKFEVAAEFTTLERDNFSGKRTEPGFGGRFTYNLNSVFSLETAGYFFPKRCFGCRNNGNVTEVLGGVKVGKRFENWGIFAKARPGVVSFSEGKFDIISGSSPFELKTNRLNSFAADLGGVVEFYPSKRIVTRFDAGDTIIHFKRSDIPIFSINSTIIPFPVPARTSHNFQFMASVGFRF
jgi:hypothetical protein